jgi:hypothetical protein
VCRGTRERTSQTSGVATTRIVPAPRFITAILPRILSALTRTLSACAGSAQTAAAVMLQCLAPNCATTAKRCRPDLHSSTRATGISCWPSELLMQNGIRVLLQPCLKDAALAQRRRTCILDWWPTRTTSSRHRSGHCSAQTAVHVAKHLHSIHGLADRSD